MYASPRQTVIAGPPEQVDAVIAAVTARTGWRAASTSMWPRTTRSWIRSCPNCVRRWPVWRPQPRHPDHHHRRPTPATPVLDAEYWVANLRNPVRFSQAITTAGRRAHHLHRNQPPPDADPRHHRNPGVGYPSPQHRDPAARHPRHPHLPHQPQHHPHQQSPRHPAPTRTAPGPTRHPLAPHPPLGQWHHADSGGGAHPLLGIGVTDPTNGTRVWESTLGPDVLWLGDHRVDDACVLPGAVYAELALAAATEAFGATATSRG